MARRWIVKTEPTTYSYQDLEREKRTVWDGVKNNLALRHMRAMAKGDRVMVYHSGKEKAVVGLAEIVKGPYPDPGSKDPKLVVVELAAKGAIPKPVTLTDIKADKAFEDLALVRMPRLSVMPIDAKLWNKLLAMGGKK